MSPFLSLELKQTLRLAGLDPEVSAAKQDSNPE